jgi:6-phospho-3-hexuloisomerase
MVLKTSKEVIKNIQNVLDKVDENQVDEFLKKIGRSKTIFLVGAGRSGIVAKAFAMRLMHLGFNVHVVGETITPAIKKEDLLIAVSGSGKTKSTLTVVKTAKKHGATITSITSFPRSPIARLSHTVVVIKGRRKGKNILDYITGQLSGGHEPLTPLGSLFELSTMIFLDSIITRLMKIFREDEISMLDRHSNLE